MRVKALRQHPYGGRIHKKGSEYEILNQKHLQVLVAVKAVQIIGSSKLVESTAKSKTGTGKKSKSEIKTNTYARKDMQAQTSGTLLPETQPDKLTETSEAELNTDKTDNADKKMVTQKDS